MSDDLASDYNNWVHWWASFVNNHYNLVPEVEQNEDREEESIETL